MPKRANSRTKTAKGPVAFAVTMGCLTAGHALSAQEANSVTVDVGECTELESPQERFACYEARVEAELRERDSAAAGAQSQSHGDPGPPAQTAEPAAQTAERPSQAAEPSVQATDPSDRSAAREEEPREIVGVVASLRETVPNSYVITLEDGQVWRQTYPEKYRLRAGHRVTIRPTRWGESYRLEGDGLNGYIQVEKVR